MPWREGMGRMELNLRGQRTASCSLHRSGTLAVVVLSLALFGSSPSPSSPSYFSSSSSSTQWPLPVVVAAQPIFLPTSVDVADVASHVGAATRAGGLKLETGAGAGAGVSTQKLAEVYVTPGGQGVGSGCGASTSPCGTLEAALASAADGATIRLAAGRYPKASKAAALSISQPRITIVGPVVAVGQQPAAVVDCGGSKCFEALCPADGGASKKGACAGRMLAMENVAVSNGSAARGGCINAEKYSLNLTNVAFQGCAATEAGGAVASADPDTVELSSVSFTSCAVTNVEYTPQDVSGTPAPAGGALHMAGFGSAVLRGVVANGCSTSAYGSGGAVHAESGGSLSVQTSRFASCTAVLGNGGALYTALMGSVAYDGNTFSECKATIGGAVFDAGSTSLSLSQSSFTKTRAEHDPMVPVFAQGGAGFFNATMSLSVSHTNFSACSCQEDGGGLYLLNVPASAVTDSRFEDVTSTGTFGGAIATQTAGPLDIHRTAFIRCALLTSYGFGGALGLVTTVVNVSASVFRDCFAKELVPPGGMGSGFPATSQGGAVVFQASRSEPSTFKDVVFEGNLAVRGAAVYTDSGTVVMSGVQFVRNGNVEDAAAGSAIFASANVSCTNCVFDSNVVGGQGGAVKVQREGTIKLTNCTFRSNYALLSGGALHVEDSAEVVVADSTFLNCTAYQSSGGAIYLSSQALLVERTSFDASSASTYGGAVQLEGSRSESGEVPYVLTGCNFTANSAVLGGGAVSSASTTVAKLERCIFTNNSAQSGGALYLSEFSNFTFDNSTCFKNQAQLSGGCMSLLGDAAAVFSDSRLDANHGANEGGVARVSGLSAITFLRCDLQNNRAAWGGVVWNEMSGSFSANDSNFVKNTADFQAGALYSTHTSTVTLVGSTFSRNRAVHGGAVLADAMARVIARNCTFTENRMSALQVQGLSQAVVHATRFENNADPTGNGGAVVAGDSCSLSLLDCLIANNSAKVGGGLYAHGSPQVTVGASTFIDNTARVGAAVVLTGSANASLAASTFSRNRAADAGAGVAVLDQSQGLLQNCTFDSNYAGSGGAGVYVDRSDVFGTDLSQTPFVVRLLNFSGNTGADGDDSGAAFFDATYNPKERTACQYCVSASSSDTLGTVPADLDMRWEGRAESLKSLGYGSTFTVWTAVGTPINALQVVVLDYYGNVVRQDNSSMARISPDMRISGLLRGTAVRGAVAIPPINVDVPPAKATPFNLTVTVSSPTNAFPDITRTFAIAFCAAGEFFNSTTFQCQPCLVGHWCAAGQPMQPCPDGTFSFYPGASDEDADCIACDDDGLNCQDGILKVDYQNWLDPQSLNSTPTTYPCIVTNGCNGYTYLGPDTPQCLDGYSQTNPMCCTCENNYYMFLQYCEYCTQTFKNVFPLLLVLVLVAWVAMVILADTFQSMDVFLNEVQLLVLIGSFNLNYPAMWMMRIVQIFNLAVFDPDVIGPQCTFTYSFVQRFYASLAIPLVGLAIYGLAYLRHVYLGGSFVHVHSLRTQSFSRRTLHRSVSRRREASDFVNSIIHASFNWLDICYIMVLTRVFAVFKPQFVGSEWVIAAAPEIGWGSSAHTGMLVTATIYTVFYIAALPLYYAYVLVSAHKKNQLNSTEFKQKHGWLVDRYKRNFWWWHLVNMALRVFHAALLAFGIQSPNIQVVIIMPIQALRIATQYKSSPFASLSLDYLQASLTLGEFMFTLSLVCYNYINLNGFSQFVFGVSTALMLGPFLFTFVYEAVNKHLELTNNRLLAKMWKVERKEHKDKFSAMDPYDLVDLHEISDWFRPHVVFALLLTKKVEERQLLMQVRDRVQACKLTGLANVDWVNHLKKPQLYAVLSQALLGASAGHITVARIPRNGLFCKQHGMWHTHDECRAMLEPEAAAAAGGGGGGAEGQQPPRAVVAWPPKLDRHVSWGARSSSSGDLDAAERERAAADAVNRSAAATAAEASPATGGGPAGSSSSSLGSSPSIRPSTPVGGSGREAAIASLALGPSARNLASSPMLSKVPSIKVQNLKVKWGGGEGSRPGSAGDSGRVGAGGGGGGGGGGAEEFVEAKMNMAELTLTFQRHLSMLVHSEKKKKEDSLRLVVRSEAIPTILSWLTSSDSNQEDQKLLRRLVVAVKEAAKEETGGLDWWRGILCFYTNRVTFSKHSHEQAVEVPSSDVEISEMPTEG